MGFKKLVVALVLSSFSHCCAVLTVLSRQKMIYVLHLNLLEGHSNGLLVIYPDGTLLRDEKERHTNLSNKLLRKKYQSDS